MFVKHLMWSLHVTAKINQQFEWFSIYFYTSVKKMKCLPAFNLKSWWNTLTTEIKIVPLSSYSHKLITLQIYKIHKIIILDEVVISDSCHYKLTKHSHGCWWQS